MKTRLALVVPLALTASVSVLQSADITGKITLKGTPPPEASMGVDPTCGKLRGSANISSRHYVVGADGALADVFVYVKGGLSSKPAAPATPVVIDQVNCEYTPYVVGAQTKQKILVKNSDPLLHNVHPMPAPGTQNKEANRAQLPKGPDLEFVFPDPEVLLRFKCDVHPWMFAYVGLLDHPYFAVTDKDGNYTIKNVPAGNYTIEALHRKTHLAGGKGLTQEVTVGADGAKANFVVELK